MGNHSLTESIPEYLLSYITEQDLRLYTAIDHASWRFILKLSKVFFVKHAHKKYLDGLSETGISMESIPRIDDMDACLRKFNWRAVSVSGFIPPSVFMEFLSLGILPIACDMRTLEHMAYTPAPDIVHEAAGHAPILADPEYAAYLRSYGEISQKAIFSHEDLRVYFAIRNLSDIKEDSASTQHQIEKAQSELDSATAALTFVSEASLLARMGWWTFEYGLVGSLSHPKIYGAGLLSSLGESFHCLSSKVKKLPFSIRCIDFSYDITRPQPQLFVAANFQELTDALIELGNQMAYSIGGKLGLDKAIQAKTVTTTVFETGIQVSGILSHYLTDLSGNPCYLQFQGPTQISFENQEILGQGSKYHKDGFGTPTELVTDEKLSELNLIQGQFGRIEFSSGVIVEGKLTRVLREKDRIVLLSFESCTVKKGDQILFRPEWGTYDMICGHQVISVFGGAADRKKYMLVPEGLEVMGKKQHREQVRRSEAAQQLIELYSQVRQVREREEQSYEAKNGLEQIHEKLEAGFQEDWLLRFELLEIAHAWKFDPPWEAQVRNRLAQISDDSAEKADLIKRGLDLLQ